MMSDDTEVMASDIEAPPAPGTIEYIASATWLRSVIAAGGAFAGFAFPLIPAAVSIADLAITGRAQAISQRRLQVLLAAWQSEAARLDATKLDSVFLDSEEFHDLVQRAWEQTKRTRHDEKIKLYARILVGAVAFKDSDEYDPEDYLRVIGELSVKDLNLARLLYQQQGERTERMEKEFWWLLGTGGVHQNMNPRIGEPSHEDLWRYQLADKTAIGREDVRFHLLRLEQAGLVYETGPVSGGMGGLYSITPTFQKLMRFLGEQSVGAEAPRS